MCSSTAKKANHSVFKAAKDIQARKKRNQDALEIAKGKKGKKK